MKLSSIAFAFLLGISCLQAQIINPGLSGSTSYDGWENLTSVYYPQSPNYGGSFPGAAPWTQAIVANQPGSSGARYIKTSGNGFTASGGVYSPFTYSGYEVSDLAPQASLKTIVLQIYLSTGEGGIGINGIPTLNLNGGVQALAATNYALTYSVYGGMFDPGTGPEAYYNNVYTYQWDLSGFVGAINSFDIDYFVGHHTVTYALRLDQSDVYTQVVPEPSTWALLLCGGGLVFYLRRRRLAQAR